jgi:hypothetical protein
MLRLLLATALAGAVTATAVAAPKERERAEKSSDSGDKIICKRFVETGSLVKGTRSCKSKRDWERERDAIRDRANMGGGTCGQPSAAASC